MSSTGGDEMLDGCDGLDTAAGADGGGVGGGGGGGEMELGVEGPALQEAVDEAGVKNVSGAGGVNGLNVEGGCVVELRSVPGQDALFAECGGSEAGAKLFLEGGQGFFQVRLFREATGDISAGDEVVDALQEGFHAGVEFIYVGDDGNAGGARPVRGDRCSGGILSIHVTGACLHHPFLPDVFPTWRQTFFPLSQNIPFARIVD